MEEHPDVLKLENRLKKTWHKRELKEMREKARSEHDVDEDIPPNLFYCHYCDDDYVPERIYKREVQDWNTQGVFRFWKARCSCLMWNTRLISDKVRDTFFIKSPSLKRERRLMRNDILQPGETGFSMLYGNKQ